jgi:chromosome segregation ATPase
MPDSPEELRQRVDELESTIRGLTQELVEANERIRQLEAELETRPETIVAGDGDGDADEEEEAAASTKPLGTEMETDPDATGDSAESTTESDTPTEDTEEDETDDIIVA